MEEFSENLLLNIFNEDINPAEQIEIDNLSELNVTKNETGKTEHTDRERKASTAHISENNRELNTEEDAREFNEREIRNEEAIIEKHLRVIKTEKYRYIGETVENLREGFGICYYNNGSVHIGQWRDNKKQGYGKRLSPTGDIFQGEMTDNRFEGYCEEILVNKNTTTKGVYINNAFIDYVIIESNNIVYEGEQIDNERTRISIGKLYNKNKPNKYFLGEVYDYREECGYGILLSTSNTPTLYLGEMRHKQFINFVQILKADGSCIFNFLKNNKRNDISFNFDKEGKVRFGYYEDDNLKGAVFHYSSSTNLPKSSVRMDIYLSGFRVKSVDKKEACRKYLQLYYPEYAFILNLDYERIIPKLNSILKEDIEYLNSIKSGETGL